MAGVSIVQTVWHTMRVVLSHCMGCDERLEGLTKHDARLDETETELHVYATISFILCFPVAMGLLSLSHTGSSPIERRDQDVQPQIKLVTVQKQGVSDIPLYHHLSLIGEPNNHGGMFRRRPLG